MVLFQPSQLKLKSGLIPFATKLNEENFSTWQKSVLLTVRTLKLESHYDSALTPPQFEEIVSSEEKDTKLAFSTSTNTEGETRKPLLNPPKFFKNPRNDHIQAILDGLLDEYDRQQPPQPLINLMDEGDEMVELRVDEVAGMAGVVDLITPIDPSISFVAALATLDIYATINLIRITKLQLTQPQQPLVPYANSYLPPPFTSFDQPKVYLTAPSTIQDSTWFADSGACHHVTAEHANIMEHSDSSQTPDQLYVGNGKRVPICCDKFFRHNPANEPDQVIPLKSGYRSLEERPLPVAPQIGAFKTPYGALEMQGGVRNARLHVPNGRLGVLNMSSTYKRPSSKLAPHLGR
ncbi:hypothetical protein PIB30_029256 [Stylosanthes scabra]|uniref:Retrotransposon Copia-like N-terminal domain-containing protein n=1 Tax=Stylosanthes scabra TaxID=79078 RepID=A0ABU6TAX9_9FABA|nr:hypothetical protein [Stylosanthes scabra]